MATLQRLLSQARRHSHISPLPWLHRSLCSSPSSSQPDPNPNPNTNPNPNPNRPQSVSVQPVSYPIKPKDPSPSPSPAQNPVTHDRPDPNTQTPQTWSREDVRFVRDFNVSSGVNRVAPLPEDKSEEDVNRTNEEMEAERRKIEADNRVMRRVFRVEEHQTVPFPTLLQRQNTKGVQKVVHDLKEAVQLVKANAKRNFDETLEAHVKLAVDLRRTDLKLTGSLSLPHGSGKALRVAVFAEGTAADEARAAGADLVGGEDLIEGIKKEIEEEKKVAEECAAAAKSIWQVFGFDGYKSLG